MDNNQIIKLIEAQNLVLKEIMGEDGSGMKLKNTPANFSTYTPLHGSGGLFTHPGLEREIVTAHVRPYGIANTLRLLPSVFTDPRFGAITGWTAPTGSQPTYACQDAPAGYMKACNLTARFGRLRYDTQTIDIDDVMLRFHRGDHTDLLLVGSLLGDTNLAPSGMNESDVLNVVTKSEMIGVAVNTEKELSKQIWQGTYGVSHQFPGLDSQIATGQVDAETGVACPALDSDVKDFAYDLVGGTGRDIVEYVSMLEYYISDTAEGSGLDPVNWVFVMRPQLFFELTGAWPCLYHTGCAPSVNTNSTVFLDGRDNTSERDAMRKGNYITVNGKTYNVITDTGIFEHNSTNNANLLPGEYASSIYMLPLTVRGGMPVTYREYVDYRKAQPDMSLIQRFNPQFFWSDNGLFNWAYEGIKWCFKLSLKTEQRVVLRTPHLAGRIDHVKYTPLQHLKEPYAESPYNKDGGVSLRSALGEPLAIWSA